MKQRHGTELRDRNLASVKPEISQALDSLFDELQASDESKILRSPPMKAHELWKTQGSYVYATKVTFEATFR